MSTSFVVNAEKVASVIKGHGPIIVVDDDADQKFLVDFCYKKANRVNEIIFLHGGEEFIDHMRQITLGKAIMPELVLLDINMPGTNGFDALKEIRKVDSFQNIPVIFMLTASSSRHDIESAKELGANGFWTKPLNIDEYVTFFKNI